MKAGVANIIVALAMAATSCGTDEPQAPVSDDYIAMDLGREATTTLTIKEFKVTAVARAHGEQPSILMDDVIVTRKGLNRWEYYPPVKWPASKTVDFYAVSPSAIDMKVNIWWQNIIDYSNPTGDTDLLVSVRKGVTASMGGPKLNFRHALAMVLLNVRSTVEYPLQVRLAKVAIKDVADHGTFVYPEVSTSPDTNNGDLFDQWTIYNMTNVTYPIFSAQGYMALSAQPVALIPEGKFMLPAQLTPLKNDGYWQGSHIELTYEVWNIEENKHVWPTTRTPLDQLSKEIPGHGVSRISIASATPDGRWVPGKSYNYTVDMKMPADLKKSPATMSASRGGGVGVDCMTGDIP